MHRRAPSVQRVQAGRWGAVVQKGGGSFCTSGAAPGALARREDDLLVEISRDLGDDRVGVRVEDRAHLAAVLCGALVAVPQRVVAHATAVHRGAGACWSIAENPQLWSGLSRAPEAAASFRAARALIWGAQERPEPSDGPGRQMERCRQAGQAALSTSRAADDANVRDDEEAGGAPATLALPP